MKIHIWADGTYCEPEDLEEYLAFMSDDFATLVVPDGEDPAEFAARRAA